MSKSSAISAVVFPVLQKDRRMNIQILVNVTIKENVVTEESIETGLKKRTFKALTTQTARSLNSNVLFFLWGTDGH